MKDDKNVNLTLVKNKSGKPPKNCLNGECPSFYEGDDGNFYIQGYKTSSELKVNNSIPVNEDVVMISSALINFIKNLK